MFPIVLWTLLTSSVRCATGQKGNSNKELHTKKIKPPACGASEKETSYQLDSVARNVSFHNCFVFLFHLKRTMHVRFWHLRKLHSQCPVQQTEYLGPKQYLPAKHWALPSCPVCSYILKTLQIRYVSCSPVCWHIYECSVYVSRS